jgi:hypothetical protein
VIHVLIWIAVGYYLIGMAVHAAVSLSSIVRQRSKLSLKQRLLHEVTQAALVLTWGWYVLKWIERRNQI